MMPVMVMPPVIMVVAPVMPMADAPGAIIGPDDAAAVVRVIIGIVIVIIGVIAPVDEAPAEVVPVGNPVATEPMAAVAKSAVANT
jgi:hypothetical protein